MPIPPQPRTFICPSCGWQRTTIPASDALLPGIDWLQQCAVCQHEPLESRSASPVEIMRVRLAEFFRSSDN